jgi:hypothetical protein
MTRTFKAHWDGKVIVPDEPVELPEGEKLEITAAPAASGPFGPPDPLPPGTPGWKLVEAARAANIPHEDIAEMERAIEEGCGRVNPDDWK